MRSPDELREILLRSFPLRSFDLPVGTATVRITTAEDIEDLINGISEAEFRHDERLPYWADVWHSAVALGDFLLQRADLVRGRSVLEIGCGLGVPGIIAASLGASVTFSDNDATALLAAELNLLTTLPGVVASFASLDFRTPPDRRWPVILAADVIYEARFIDPLAIFLDRTLEKNGTVVLAEPNRLIAVPFFARLAECGFRHVRHTVEASLHGRKVDVSIYLLTRRGPT
ncbi:MAG: methyltransferase [Ignavibacteria bacterium]|nr:methyltransferase [Ignavibacteria bacterium]